MRQLGYKGPDDPDPRDYPLKLKALGETPLMVELPRSPILNQGSLSSCVSNAIAQAIRIVLLEKGEANPELLSRLFSYWIARNQHGDAGVDNGTFIRLAIKGLNRVGRPPESAWPYDVNRYSEKPPPAVFMEAHDKRKANYYRIAEYGAERVEVIKRALAAGHPVVFGTDVSTEFLDNVGTQGVIKPPVDGQLAGGHAMVVTGYNQVGPMITNSWGDDWGQGGRARFDWSYLTWERTRDLWAIDI